VLDLNPSVGTNLVPTDRPAPNPWNIYVCAASFPPVGNLSNSFFVTNRFTPGIKLVHAGVIAALARVGIEPYSPEGERFDPQHHEAVAQQPVEGATPGTVVEVYQRGYRLRDGSVLRPARVVVAA